MCGSPFDDAQIEHSPGTGARPGSEGDATATADEGYRWRSRVTPEPKNVSHSIRALLGVHSHLEPGQCHEDDTAEVVLVCEPDLHNNLMGALHPNGMVAAAPP